MSVLPASTTSLNEYLFFSSNNIIEGPTAGFQIVSPCTGTAPTFINANPFIAGGDFTETSMVPIDPRPACGSAAYSNVDPVPNGDTFFSATTYKGAFGSVNWLNGWSLFNLPNRPGFADGAFDCSAAALSSDPVAICGSFTVDQVFSVGPTYMLTCQTFVNAGVTIRIQAGIVMYATPVGLNGVAPALVVARGGKIIADGTATATITFTALNPERSSSGSVTTDSSLASILQETRGQWGGIIILGNAPTSAASPLAIEGITGYTYGGNKPTESSGILRYVRVWHGGAVVGADNEINGITFGGVGSGTIVDHCEVAFNVDDGFEFFGGTVNVKYLSVLFMGDDGFDMDQGYIGKGQFLFVIEGLSGDHSMEIDSGNSVTQDVTPRSHPAFYSFTLIGGGSGTGARTGELMHINDGTGGKFGNGILAHPHLNGLLFEDCGSTLSYTQTLPAGSAVSYTHLTLPTKRIV